MLEKYYTRTAHQRRSIFPHNAIYFVKIIEGVPLNHWQPSAGFLAICVGSNTDDFGYPSKTLKSRSVIERERLPAGRETVMDEFSNQVYDPETLAVLEAAFDEAWAALKINSDGTVTPDALAQSILKLANRGERDPERLRNGALLELVAAYKSSDKESAGL
jgi:hypothetical protein